jgi:copper chaperone CopZ
VNPEDRHGLFASGSAIVAAIGASSCCILPLFLGSLGSSAVVAAGALESLRPYLLGASALLIGAGWYTVYGRRPASSCEVSPSRLQRSVRPVLVASTLAVIGFASFPVYAPALAGGSAATQPSGSVEGSSRLVLHVDGMTCAACAVEITNALRAVPGVLDAGVDYEAAQAWALVQVDSAAKRAELTAAVEGVGFGAQLTGNGA